MNQTNGAKSRMCFVIGPIGDEGSEIRKRADMLLNVTIKPALLNNELNLFVKRADEDHDPGTIHDRVVTDIIESEIVVVDFTGLNANAMYELGIRHMTMRPTIHMAEVGTKIPFDNVPQRMIFFDTTDFYSLQRASEKLKESAILALSPGYKATNPVVHAQHMLELRSSEDPRDAVIAELQEKVSNLENISKKQNNYEIKKLRNMESHMMLLGNSQMYDEKTMDKKIDIFQKVFSEELVKIHGKNRALEVAKNVSTKIGINNIEVSFSEDNVMSIRFFWGSKITETLFKYRD